MQLPFVRRVMPHASIVPLVVGRQTPEVARELGRALARALQGTNAVMVGQLGPVALHAGRDRARDGLQVVETVEQFEPDALQALLERNDRHACGGGPMVAVMRAAKALGAQGRGRPELRRLR